MSAGCHGLGMRLSLSSGRPIRPPPPLISRPMARRYPGGEPLPWREAPWQHRRSQSSPSRSPPSAWPMGSALASLDEAEMQPTVNLSNDAAHGATELRVAGRRDGAALAQITQIFADQGLAVSSANLVDGGEDVYHLTLAKGGAVPQERWGPLRDALLRVLQTGARSSKPSIHGAQVEVDERVLRALPTEADASALEHAAHDMVKAADALVNAERDLLALGDHGDQGVIQAKQTARYDLSSQLERRMAALEAILTSRREQLERAMKEATAPVPDFFKPPSTTTTGPAAGSGYEIILQAFNWESCKEAWWQKLTALAPKAAEVGFTAAWLPPPSESVSSQGYLPRDLYNLDSKYGSEAELRNLISVCHELEIKAIADIVINHRCAHYQGDDGKWNKFGGRLAWDRNMICSNNPAFGGRGAWKKFDDYPAAPNVDHSNERVQEDIIGWMKWLRNSIGFDGWRFDYVKGYDGKYAKMYVDATVPQMAFGEYWDTCAYTDGVLNYNQDAHRQRTVDWCDSTGATCAAFDFTLKGILQEAVSRGEYWRLIDNQGRPPGVLGMWPSRAITFLENHDTGSTLQHWPFPWEHAAEGYAYILTHCGTPCIFYDHMYYDAQLREHITRLIEIRRRFRINNKSEVVIHKAYGNLYCAIIDKKIAMKIGPGDWSPSSDRVQIGQRDWRLLHSGPSFAVWEAVFG